MRGSNWVNEYITTLPSNSQTFARELIEGEFIRAIKVIKRLIEKGEPRKAIHRSTTILPTNAVFWICEGFLPTAGVKGICDEIGLGGPVEQKEEKCINGWGTFFYPLITVGTKHRTTFADKVAGRMPAFFSKRGYVGDCAGFKVYVGDDGFIGVLCEEPEMAFNILNTILASSLVKGIETYPLQPREMQDIRFNLTSKSFDRIGEPSTHGTLRTSSYRDLISYSRASNERRTNVSLRQMRQLIRLADQLMKDNETTKLLRFFHESYTHMRNHEYNSAFVLAWQTVETWISKQWMLFLQSKRLTRNDIRKLADWNVDNVIQTLHLFGKIDSDIRTKLNELRVRRNRILHRAQFATKQDVENCVGLAFKFLKEYVPNTKLELPLERRHVSRRPRVDETAITIELADYI